MGSPVFVCESEEAGDVELRPESDFVVVVSFGVVFVQAPERYRTGCNIKSNLAAPTMDSNRVDNSAEFLGLSGGGSPAGRSDNFCFCEEYWSSSRDENKIVNPNPKFIFDSSPIAPLLSQLSRDACFEV